MEETMNIQNAIKDIQQSRSRYQLEKFVVGQHDSPEMQYYQLVVEANGTTNSIKETELRIEKVKAEAEELRETGKKSDSIEAQIKELSIPELETQLIGQRRELAFMEELFLQYENYTREDIELAQPEYWRNRLMRVGEMQMLARQGGVDWAHLQALYQADVLHEAITKMPTMAHLDGKSDQLLTAKIVEEKTND
tara:strand:- start:400 stop:981 length:582 start_codon:yes stop_codon:yes gene_type:complete